MALIITEGPQYFFQDSVFPLFEARDSGFKSRKSRRVSGLKVCAGGGTPKITLGITELHEILSRDYGIENPIGDPHYIVES